MAFLIAPGVVVERLGDVLLVIVPGSSEVISLSGHAAEVLLKVTAGHKVDPLEPALKQLLKLGVLTTPSVSRRGLVKAGAFGAGVGVAIMAMPGVAVASSSCLDGGSGTYRNYGGGLTAFRWNAPDYPTPLPHGAIELSNGETISPDGYTTDSGLEIVGLDWVGTFSGLGGGNPVTGEFSYGQACYRVTFSLIVL